MSSQTLYRRNFLLHLQNRIAYPKPVLLKEPAHEQLSAAQIGQLHNEYAISRQLADVSGVRPAFTLEGSESHPVLLLKYIQGNSLAEINQIQSLDLEQKLKLAIEITAVLGRIHDAGVMHRDISSGNILVAKDGEVVIIDFGLASTLRQEEMAQPVATDVVAGTLAYISPEQTGRMNRAVDYRSDLYSLGVTLYELLTGQLPFQAKDTLEMIHDHMALQPSPLPQLNHEIPETLSAIILKLLAKNAEERYQSARGLRADLARCLERFQNTSTVEPFSLGQDDFSGRLQIPQKLYGRQAEVKQLIDTYDRVAQGNTELLFIAGYSGVGKTALVHEIRREVLMKQGNFIEGKFDQLQRTLPYSAWEQAFTQLVNNWLALNEDNLAHWRDSIMEAVGESGQVLIDVIPSLERIIGPQPEVPQLGGLENQNRFNYTFNRFISSLATEDTPLVVFLDDLQWIDSASLSLIESLLAVQSESNLLIIGAYRDNEVGPTHPLAASQERLSDQGHYVRTITLADLKPDDVDHLLADSLQLLIADCSDLSQILREKTAGNPFYFRQQLYALESEAILSFNREQGRWEWEAELQQSLEAGGNVVDLMVRKIQTLPEETQQTLSMAACIGNRFDSATLSTITNRSQMDILSDLNPALQGSLIFRSNGLFSFTHDRIQEAGYSFIPETELPKTHLEIGRLLLENVTDEKLDEEIFAIVGNLNAGRTLIDMDSEKIKLASLNLKAGQKAKVAAAFANGKQYIEVGIELLGPGRWQENYELTLSMYNENAELASFTGQYEQIEPIAKLIHANARNFMDRLRIDMILIEAETVQYNLPKALELGLKVLRDLDVEIPARPTPEDYQRLNERLVALLSDISLEDIIELPEMTDERALAISSILAAEMSTAYIVDPQLSVIIQYLGAIFTLELGLNAWSPFFFGVISLLNIGTVTHETPTDVASAQIRFANQLVGIVRKMLENPITSRGRTKALQSLTVAAPWLEPIENGLESAHATYQSGFEFGDLLYGAYGTLHYAMQGFAAGINLDVYQSILSDINDGLSRVGQITTTQYFSIYLQTAQNLKEKSQKPDKLNGIYFDEDEWLPKAHEARDHNGLQYFLVNKLILVYHFDLDNKLAEWIIKAEESLATVPTVFSTATAYFYLPLARLRSIRSTTQNKSTEIMNLINNGLKLLTIWAKSVPSTFQHQVDLIVAEKARVLGDVDGALSHYEQAIHGARESGFIHEEALANELYARFWAERGNERFAGQFMREADTLYRKWGALAKAEHLASCYPDWLVRERITVGSSQTRTSTSQLSGNLDILTVLKSSQAIASEIELENLLVLLMNNTIENSGAQLGYLLLPEDTGWVIAAQANMEKSRLRIEGPISITESDQLSHSIVNYVMNTQETILLDDASQSNDFADDPYLQNQKVKSLLCTPLVNQGEISAVLYLENNLSPGVFTSERIELLKLLSAQMAISIDNARTHGRLEELLEERSRALDSAQEQIRFIFENSPLGISLSTLSGQFLTVNTALLDMLGVSEAELVQRGVIDFYANPADRETLLAELQKSGVMHNVGMQLLRHDGSPFFGNVNVSHLVLDDSDVLLVIVEDVTDQLATEQEAATLEERERLARDLHDAVTQTLFSASVLAQSSPRMLDKNPTLARQNLKQLEQLISGALVEMRTLLIELRPNQFADKSLAELFELLIESTRARTQTNISLHVDEACAPPQDVALVFYRIAQESLNNVAKHALPSQVTLDFNCQPEATTMRITDDGRGFDPQAIPVGHMGVSIMRERAQKIGATIEIKSQIGQGTQVSVSWSKPEDNNTNV